MKYSFFLLLLATSFNLLSQEKCTLQVNVQNIRSSSGSINVALFTDEDSFLEEEWTFKSEPVTGKDQLTVEFGDIPPGTYGISVFHDENDNEELDTNFIGIPKEAFGFGNDAMGAFGPPGFRKASVTVSPGITRTSVKLKSF